MMARIPLMVPHVPKSAVSAVSKVLQTRWIGQGPRVEEFEQKFVSKIAPGKTCVAVGSGTDALHLAYLLAGIKPGDEVIAPLFTCTATNIPLLYCGAKIVFCDVAPDSLNMDPKHLQHLVNDKTKAIVTVHYGGAPVSKYVYTHAEAFNIPVIEDCAQALGAVGVAKSAFSCFSFQAVKHVTTGDGGMLVIDDEDLEAEAKRRRWFGIDREAKLNGIWENDILEIGFKYQMTDIAAVMGIEGLKSLDNQLRHRRVLRAAYIRGLTGTDGIQMLDRDPASACWLCTVAVERRADLRRKLLEYGVESDLVHYRNDRYAIFRESRGKFPNMDAIDKKYLVLPMHMGMDEDDVVSICEMIRGGW